MLSFPDKQTLSSLLKKVSHRMTSIKGGDVQEVCPIGIIDFKLWEWPQGVGLYGLWRNYELTGDAALLNEIRVWFDARIKEGLPPPNVNTTAPMLTLIHLYEKTGDKTYGEICKKWAQWIYEEMPRTEEDGLQHIVTGEPNPQQLWDDTLYMTVLFLAKAGVVFDKKDYVEASIYQFLVHIKYLYDTNTGLWFHGWTFDGRHNFAKALWARGNCWITAVTFDYLQIVDVGFAVKKYLVNTVKAQIAALKKFQHESGLWHTLVDDPSSYLETSAASGFAYGILKGIRLGYIGAEYADVALKALKGIVANIQPDGTVIQVSYGTGMGRDLEHYRKIPLCPMAYGQALTVLMLGEAIHHSNS